MSLGTRGPNQERVLLFSLRTWKKDVSSWSNCASASSNRVVPSKETARLSWNGISDMRVHEEMSEMDLEHEECAEIPAGHAPLALRPPHFIFALSNRRIKCREHAVLHFPHQVCPCYRVVLSI
jgi:hypothetical protein